MATQSIITCPHCGKSSKVIPLRNSTNIPQQTILESTQAIVDTGYTDTYVEHRNFWASDGATYALAATYAGGALAAFAWWYELDIGGAIATTVILTGVGLHVLKIWLHRPERTTSPAAAAETTIKVEQWDFERGQAILQEIEDSRLTLDLLQRVAKAIADGANFSRPQLTKQAGISQSKYHALKDEFARLNFTYTDKGNRTHLLRAGKAFLRQVLNEQ